MYEDTSSEVINESSTQKAGVLALREEMDSKNRDGLSLPEMQESQVERPKRKKNRMKADPEKRFWKFVYKTKSCWLWTGSISQGYGKFWDQKHFRAHRWSYEKFVGPIPEGLILDHLCRNPRCVNPSHLEPVTTKENIRRGFGVAGVNFRKTHCDHGHEFNEFNTVFVPRGRGCRTCYIERKRKVREALRGDRPKWKHVNHRALRTHCKRNLHELEGANLMSKRQCRACRNMLRRERGY